MINLRKPRDQLLGAPLHALDEGSTLQELDEALIKFSECPSFLQLLLACLPAFGAWRSKPAFVLATGAHLLLEAPRPLSGAVLPPRHDAPTGEGTHKCGQKLALQARSERNGDNDT